MRKYRLILNLAKFNENINTAMNIISKNCYFASVDLCDGYYSVPIASEHRKYLRFTWKQQMYEFTCLPNKGSCLRASAFHEINETCSCHPLFCWFYFSGIFQWHCWIVANVTPIIKKVHLPPQHPIIDQFL